MTDKGETMQSIDVLLSPEVKLFIARFNTGGDLAMPMVEEAYSIKGKETKWFVIYTNPKCEKRACEGLNHKGLPSYTPKTADWRKQSRRDVHQKKPRVKIERPLFTRYALVELPVSDGHFGKPEVPFGTVRLIDGVREIVGTPDGPVTVSHEIIQALRSREDRGEFDKTTKRRVSGGTTFAPKWVDVGKEVQIKDGPFAEFLAIIEEVLPHEMIKVGIKIFGRDSPATLSIDQVRAA